jgi:hypothetical protein
MHSTVKRKTGLASLTVLGLTLSGPAAAGTIEDFHTWGDVMATGSLGAVNPDLNKVKYMIEGLGRFGDNSSRLSLGMLRTGLGYAINDEASVWLGYAWVTYDEPFAKTPFDEHRIWQDFSWSHTYAYATLSTRSRLEQRFMDTGSDVGWRFRQRIKVSVPLAFAPDFSLVGGEEYFANINQTNFGADDGFDQNRVFGGLGYDFNKHTKAEIGYMNIYLRRSVSDRMYHYLAVNVLFKY